MEVEPTFIIALLPEQCVDPVAILVEIKMYCTSLASASSPKRKVAGSGIGGARDSAASPLIGYSQIRKVTLSASAGIVTSCSASNSCNGYQPI